MEALRLITCAFAYCVILLAYDGILGTDDHCVLGSNSVCVSP